MSFCGGKGSSAGSPYCIVATGRCLESLPELSHNELTRYSRHLILPEVGMDGQKRLKSARVLVVGAGGLGSPVSLYLAAAGVGNIGIVDFDSVDLSNLQRQILHSTEDVGRSKIESARNRINAMSPDVNVIPHELKLDANNALQIIENYDVVVDGTDNFSTRYLINDACVLSGKPNVHGSIYRFEGQASVFASGNGPCYRCLFPDAPPPDAVPNCAEGGVLGVLAGLIGVIQATETIKLILHLGTTLVGRLLIYDALEMRFESLRIARNPSCPVCGDKPTIRSLIDVALACSADTENAQTGRMAQPKSSDGSAVVREVEARTLRDRLASRQGAPLLLDVRNKEEYQLCKLEGSILIPLPELPERTSELSAENEIVVYCKSGGRSKKAAELLISRGFKNVSNLSGGILAWIRDVDPTMPSY